MAQSTGAAIPSLQLTSARRVRLDARPDTVDFRDQLYVPTLIEVSPRLPLADYRAKQTPVLDQGTEGACTGFGLATVANYLLHCRRVDPDPTPVSPRMLYELARRYDEWPGEDYSGSSARGAMKGWHKHGVCSEDLWPYRPDDPDLRLTDQRLTDAVRRPLGAYFRVNHKNLVAMHSALAEVGILYATATVHAGWQSLAANGAITQQDTVIGGHAFAIVAYDDEGFWIQNSWGEDWGYEGFGHLTYDDWLANGTDVWVARLGAPVTLRTNQAIAAVNAAVAKQSSGFAFHELRPHIIRLGNDGAFDPHGTFGTSPNEVASIFAEDIPRLTGDWPIKRILLYAHGGLVGEASAIQRVADQRTALLAAQVYPLAFIWRTDLWSTFSNILTEAVRQRRPEGLLGAAHDFMLDRLDDGLEPLVGALGGRAVWDEIKENADRATTTLSGGARQVLQHLVALVAANPTTEIHVVGHSAGAIFHAPLIQLLTTTGAITNAPLAGATGLGQIVTSCTLWAPACTVDLFNATYRPAIEQGRIQRFAVFNLTDEAEQDDQVTNIYNKSILYLVSNAFEDRRHIPLFQEGTPLLGLTRWIERDPALRSLFRSSAADLVLAPNHAPDNSPTHSSAQQHGAFDDDGPTLRATLARILGTNRVTAAFPEHRSASSLRDRRQRLNR